MSIRTIGLFLIGVLAGMVAWLATTWYLRPRVLVEPVAIPIVEERLDPASVMRGSIEGAIANAGGEPVAGATVCANAETPRVLVYAPTPRCTRTNTAGRFTLAALYAGSYRVVAMAPELVPASAPVHVAPNDRDRVDLALTGGGAMVHGVVTDLEGEPLAGALVREARDGASVETDADGHFTLWVSPGSTVVRAVGAGYAFATVSTTAPGEVHIVLARGASLAGTVRDAPGADVTIASATGETFHALANADGQFVVDHLPSGRYTATATTPHRFGQTHGSVVVGAGESITDIAITTHAAHRVSGRVLLGERICEEAGLAIAGLDNGRRYIAWRHDDGTLMIDGVLAGSYAVTPSCPGGAPRRYPDLVVTGDIRDLEWRMDRGPAAIETTRRPPAITIGTAAIVGVAVLPHGLCDELRVSLRNADGEGVDDRFLRTRGRFAVHGLPAGHYDVLIEGDDRDHRFEVTLADHEEHRVTVVLASPRRSCRTWRECSREYSADGSPSHRRAGQVEDPSRAREGDAASRIGAGAIARSGARGAG